jgi:hypothetical protein
MKRLLFSVMIFTVSVGYARNPESINRSRVTTSSEILPHQTIGEPCCSDLCRSDNSVEDADRVDNDLPNKEKSAPVEDRIFRNPRI